MFCICFLLLLGELLVDDVDLVAILGDEVILEEARIPADNTRKVLEIKVLGVQTELGEETGAEVRPAPDGPHGLFRMADAEHGPTGVGCGNQVVVGEVVLEIFIYLLLRHYVTTARDVAEVVRVELKGIRPVRVLQVVEDTLGRRAHLLGVELHCHGNKGLQALCHLLGVDLVAVLLELIHLVGRKECGHFVLLGLGYPYSTFSKSIFDGSILDLSMTNTMSSYRPLFCRRS